MLRYHVAYSVEYYISRARCLELFAIIHEKCIVVDLSSWRIVSDVDKLNTRVSRTVVFSGLKVLDLTGDSIGIVYSLSQSGKLRIRDGFHPG